MGWHLTDLNRILVKSILHLFKDNKEFDLPTNNPSGLIYAIRSAANTEFPELKNWRFKKQKNLIVCVPKVVLIDSVDSSIVEDSKIPPSIEVPNLDYIGIISYLIAHEGESVSFKGSNLNEKEIIRLVTYCETKNMEVEVSGDSINVRQRRSKSKEASGSMG